MRVTINSQTDGNYTRSNVNGRSHIVTKMMPIRGDIAMNGVLYPLQAVKDSFDQLDNLPAPNGHPKVNGVHVSAFTPVAMNAFNVGGFIRNPTMDGKKVFVDFMLDETVANMSDDGREMIKRIEAGKSIGVSTGLNIKDVTAANGVDDFGESYTRTGDGFNFDHVAILLNEQAAGHHAGTELVLNTEDPKDPIHVVDLSINDLSSDDLYSELSNLIESYRTGDGHSWVNSVYPEDYYFIFTVDGTLYKQDYTTDSNDKVALSGERSEVIRKTEYIKPTTNHQREDHDMNKDLIVLSIIANANNAFTSADKDRLSAMSEPQLVDALSVNVDQNKAKEVLTANGFDFKAYDNFTTNKEKFDAFLANEKTKLDEIKTVITANSDYTSEMLAGKDEIELNAINSLITSKKQTKRILENGSPDHVNSDSSVSYSMED